MFDTLVTEACKGLPREALVRELQTSHTAVCLGMRLAQVAMQTLPSNCSVHLFHLAAQDNELLRSSLLMAMNVTPDLEPLLPVEPACRVADPDDRLIPSGKAFESEGSLSVKRMCEVALARLHINAQVEDTSKSPHAADLQIRMPCGALVLVDAKDRKAKKPRPLKAEHYHKLVRDMLEQGAQFGILITKHGDISVANGKPVGGGMTLSHDNIYCIPNAHGDINQTLGLLTHAFSNVCNYNTHIASQFTCSSTIALQCKSHAALLQHHKMQETAWKNWQALFKILSGYFEAANQSKYPIQNAVVVPPIKVAKRKRE